MNTVFIKLLTMSLTGSCIILIVMALRLLLKNTNKAVLCILWGLVAIRLICPVSFESRFSLIPEKLGNGNMLSEWTDDYAGNLQTIDYNLIYHDEIDAVGDEAVNDMAEKNHQIDKMTTPANVLFPVLSWIWIAGMTAMLCYAVITYVRLRRKVVLAVCIQDNIWECDDIQSPFVLGFFRPQIYLPSSINKTNMLYVVAHENAHLRRRDHWWKPIGFLVLTVHWFNPLVWAAYILLCRDIEFACDEKVIKDLETQGKKAYSEALLACSVEHRGIAVCPLAFGEVGVKERIRKVLNYKKPVFWIVVLTVLLCIVLAVCFLTNPSQEHEILEWAQNLSVEDVESIELAAFPNFTGIENKVYTGDEAAYIVSLINQSDGMHLTEHEDLNGGSIFFYITMKDGSKHQVGNIGNVYLVIDGEYYDAEYSWLDSWLDGFSEGDSEVIGDINSKQLTLSDVITLSEKGEDLSWEDFEQFSHVDTGSGLYIRAYEINEMFRLYIGGGSLAVEPMYIYLRADAKYGDFIDIRSENVEEFIKKHTVDFAAHLKENDALPEEFPLGFIFTAQTTWGSTMSIYTDGTFEGSYNASEDGERGENYPRGTVYRCEFRGRFGSIERIDDNSFSMVLEELKTAEPEGTETFEDGIRYVNTGAVGLTGGEEFILYTPDTPMEGLSMEFLNWIPANYSEGDTLSCYGLYNVNTGQGFFANPIEN